MSTLYCRPLGNLPSEPCGETSFKEKGYINVLAPTSQYCGETSDHRKSKVWKEEMSWESTWDLMHRAPHLSSSPTTFGRTGIKAPEVHE